MFLVANASRCSEAQGQKLGRNGVIGLRKALLQAVLVLGAGAGQESRST